MESLQQALELIEHYENDEIKPAFANYDLDGNGSLSKKELNLCLNDLGYT